MKGSDFTPTRDDLADADALRWHAAIQCLSFQCETLKKVLLMNSDELAEVLAGLAAWYEAEAEDQQRE